jgi:hypothetical protein
MTRIVFTIRAAAAPERCEAGLVSVEPAIPVACSHAAGPHRARAVPEGWRATQWCCAAPGAALPAQGAGLADAILAEAEADVRQGPP